MTSKFRANWAIVPLLPLLATACNQQPQINATTANTTTTSTPTTTAGNDPSKPSTMPTPQPTMPTSSRGGDARLVQLAGCSSTMRTLGRIYAVLADRESGSRRADMMQRAQVRANAAGSFRDMAIQYAASIGRTSADVDRAAAESDAEIQQASQNMPFDQFAERAGHEGDRCAQLVGPGG